MSDTRYYRKYAGQRFYRGEISVRDRAIYNELVGGRTYEQVATQLGLARANVGLIVARVMCADQYEEHRSSMPRGSLGSMRLSLRIENAMLNENEISSVDLLDFLSRVSHRDMCRWPNIGKRSIKEFADEAIKIAGEDAVMSWLNAGESHE